jgi:hypothetical protein
LADPGTSFSSLLITTDVPLLLFWSLALWAIAGMQSSRSPAWTILLGVSIGLGLLSKYAMLYFLLGISACFLFSREGRKFLDARFAAAAAIAALAFFPNVIWNISNSLATVRHTASQRELECREPVPLTSATPSDLSVRRPGIIGPVAAGIFVRGGLTGTEVLGLHPPHRLMLALSAPIVMIVTFQAFISRANANWAAPAFITLCILVCAWATRSSRRCATPA